MTANVARILIEPAAAAGAPALTVDRRAVSYGELEELARGVAALLGARGVDAGDRVAIVLPNGPAFVAALFGVLWVGAIAVPVNILLRPGEVDERLEAVEPRAMIVDAERAHELGQVARERGAEVVVLSADGGSGSGLHPAAPLVRDPEDAAVILFTSGTSGASKGAILTHGSLRAAAGNAASALGFTDHDIVLGAAPFSHVLGLSTGLIATLASGGCIALVSRFSPGETLLEMTETGTTVLLGVPTMCIALCEAARSAGAESPPPLRIAHVGGAAVPVEVISEFERMFGAGVYEGYGLTELSGIATTCCEGQARKAGSVGMPLGDTALRIVALDGVEVGTGEVGEVQFRGSTVIPGYWGASAPADRLFAGGWLATGDLGYLDDDGYLFLVDRLKEMIIRSGYNVYPREIEEVLYSHPDVVEAAVVGVTHPTTGEEVVALAKLCAGAVSDADSIRAWVRERVAAYKYPRHVVIVDELPKGPTGKLLKRAIDRDALRRSLRL